MYSNVVNLQDIHLSISFTQKQRGTFFLFDTLFRAHYMPSSDNYKSTLIQWRAYGSDVGVYSVVVAFSIVFVFFFVFCTTVCWALFLLYSCIGVSVQKSAHKIKWDKIKQ